MAHEHILPWSGSDVTDNEQIVKPLLKTLDDMACHALATSWCEDAEGHTSMRKALVTQLDKFYDAFWKLPSQPILAQPSAIHDQPSPVDGVSSSITAPSLNEQFLPLSRSSVHFLPDVQDECCETVIDELGDTLSWNSTQAGQINQQTNAQKMHTSTSSSAFSAFIADASETACYSSVSRAEESFEAAKYYEGSDVLSHGTGVDYYNRLHPDAKHCKIAAEYSPDLSSPRVSTLDFNRNEASALPKENVEKTGKTSVHAQKVLPPCRVCGDVGTGFHYGVNTCDACKVFFGRSLSRKHPYQCTGKGNCFISGKQKRICPSCRHKRCLEMGMSQKAIKTGRYTHVKRTRDYQESVRLQTASRLEGPCLNDFDVDVIVMELLNASQHVLTNADVPSDVMSLRCEEALAGCHRKKEVASLDCLTAEEFEEVYKLTGTDIDGRQENLRQRAWCLERYIRGYVQFAKGIPRLNDLSHSDQCCLLKMGRKEFWFLGAFRGFLRKHGTFYAPNGLVFTYSDHVRIMGKEYSDYEFRLAENLQRWDITREELVVLKAICLTFTDRCDLREPKKVEEIQTLLLKCFYMLLSRRHENANIALARAMDKLVAMRNLTEFERRHHSFSWVRSAFKEYPIMMEFVLC